MKTAIAVTLIVAGTLLVMTPVVGDYLYQRNVVALISQPGVRSVTLDGKMGDTYRLGCWFTGSIMIGVAVFYSLAGRRRVAEQEPVSTGAE